MEATFVHGNPLMIDYTPSAPIDAGMVVVTNDTVRIAHRAIAANELGSLASFGGVYRCVGDGVIAADKKVYWDNTANKVTLTAGTNKVFGVTATACAGDGETCLVVHMPSM